jgi:hypothetical protein
MELERYLHSCDEDKERQKTHFWAPNDTYWGHAEEAEKQQSRSTVTEQIPATPKEHRRLASSPNETNTMDYSFRLPELVLHQKSWTSKNL